ncbi:MAG: hypothetical protein HQL53_02050 [Magnetococcales bacterium]|nr:hypothetical protein [Magnetococcales bacterium]
MPLQEIVTTLMPGEAVKVVGPGVLEFQQLPTAAAMAKAGGGAVVGKGAVAAAGTGAVVTAGGVTTAQATPAGLTSGKVLGLNLASWNPWVLLAVGAFGGYLYYRQKNSGLGRFWPV